MRGWLVPIVAVAACAGSAQAQTTPTPSAPAQTTAAPSMNDVMKLALDDKLMPALVLFEQVMAANPAASGMGAQYWSFSGDIATADELYARREVDTPSQPPPDLSQVRPEPAIEAIVRAAEGRRVVMINEAHHAPRHRAFTYRLMLALREAGFTHFAAETFCSGSHCGPLLEDGAPMGAGRTGFYTMEPVFGDLARQAGAAGYTLVGYEIRPEQQPPPGTAREKYIDLREQAQAENIKALLDADPNARVLVHVGFGHLAETVTGAPLHLFGGRLKELTGEDPLTIDQIEGTPQHDSEHDTLLYKAFVAQFGSPAAPVVIANDPEHPLDVYRVDLSVIHPVQHEVNGRPDWLAMDSYRKPHVVALEPLGARSLVRAFVAGEPEGAIAMDQMLVGSGVEAVTLMLPPGSYRLVRQTEAGENLPLGAVSVD
ncbi:hypothetical protein [Altererythrobacter sp. Root672]|uniref:hypothetical protein n=1 Tax=Altererythrobacter sp. Root672 TaxID=1736584 RepID=UPI0006F4FAED|nr:hypothetical protein [Altererythrobacter sp. Root672]KRA79724.1 hypothetical protein ASD76_17025 [Altererythrobacter sp. Root672]